MNRSALEMLTLHQFAAGIVSYIVYEHALPYLLPRRAPISQILSWPPAQIPTQEGVSTTFYTFLAVVITWLLVSAPQYIFQVRMFQPRRALGKWYLTDKSEAHVRAKESARPEPRPEMEMVETKVGNIFA
jgi:hypothetical protein